jgi:predicted acylesterase/phospholipase RssA
MSAPGRHSFARLLLFGLAVAAVLGCQGVRSRFGPPTPTKAGLNTNDLIDPAAQAESDELANPRDLLAVAERYKRVPTPEQLARRRSVLCVSGGGSYGAYSAGVLCGWTARGDRPGCNGRPNFDVVTGISTGALIAPFAFLGPQYDDVVRQFYTTTEKRDIYRLRPVRGLFTVALADNKPLGDLVDEMLTPQIIAEVAEEHRKGRRLYIGTTELEGRRFVCWDLGEIAARGCPGDRELIKQILLGSSAIPGFFPPSEIPVTVDGVRYVEKHGDGGTSMSIFFQPPYLPPEQRHSIASDLAGVDLYMLVAGKLYADPDPLKARSLSIAGNSVSTVMYAQGRGDLQRIYLISMLTGMNYHIAAIPPEFPAPKSSTTFEAGPMTAMFDEGFRQAHMGTAWRSTPPGVEPGEGILRRGGTTLTHVPRTPSAVPTGSSPILVAPGPAPIPAVPGKTDK